MKLSILKYHIKRILCLLLDFPGWLHGKESACQCRRHGFNPWVGKIPWNRKWQPTLNSCLENFIDRGAQWVTVHGAAETE